MVVVVQGLKSAQRVATLRIKAETFNIFHTGIFKVGGTSCSFFKNQPSLSYHYLDECRNGLYILMQLNYACLAAFRQTARCSLYTYVVRTHYIYPYLIKAYMGIISPSRQGMRGGGGDVCKDNHSVKFLVQVYNYST